MTGIVYIHVPKCGGSSFGATLRLRHLTSQATLNLRQSRAEVTARYPTLSGKDRIEAEYAIRGTELRRLLETGTRCISAHVRYSPTLHDAFPDYRYVTLLRDPVSRFVSHYRYLQRTHPDPDRPDTLAGFCETEDAERIGSQYLFYFGGDDPSGCTDQCTRIAQAQRNLSRFTLIGDLSDPDVFLHGLKRLIRGPLPRLTRNRAPSPTRIPEELRGRIEDLCAPDIVIYRAARTTAAAT
ncbi:sulfotransferase family 2 domain-containing protein [Primorskyibacter sp. S87]|uniref:sulfotransferase family 2 domain-containing protein n=1 Tax=Primorskyibacter sp. S87 TaxID=3415126 RepID=UPI003C7A8CEA